MSIETRDIRCYLTNAGIQAELDAITNGTSIKITKMVIDMDVLPDSQTPADVTAPLNPYQTKFDVEVKRLENKLSIIGDIAADIGGFHINGVAYETDTGVTYAYARGLGDYKRVGTSGQNDVLRIECEVKTENAPTIVHTYTGQIFSALLADLDDAMRIHIEAAHPHTQYVRKDSVALDAAIEAREDTNTKHVGLKGLWKALAFWSTDDFNGESNNHYLTQKAGHRIKAYVDQKFSDLMGGLAPERIDTIVELGREIEENETALANVTNSLATKAEKTYVDGELAKKSNVGHTHDQYATHDDVTQQIETNGKGATGGINSETGKRDETFFVNKKLASASFTIKADESAAHFGELHIAQGASIEIEKGAELVLL
ncbi:hypothetical protein F0267_26040 [Vibrio coralliilyticus]|uniref:phage tail protein n=1 Tax=Vibrio TaxID=662 RepID=UPI00148D0D75|nr:MULTISPECIES: phage tail protein [Vibrio]NOH26176.1 hypothetical protein [Vibrio europaeus]NOH41691.1 hypothetical protein [Vibrio coralliilyticus]